VAAPLASYRQVRAANPLAIQTFERQFFNHMVLALDHYSFPGTVPWRARMAIRSTRCGCCAMRSWKNEGRMSASKTVRYKPETSILKFRPGDEIRLSADDVARPSAAFFDEIEKKYP
jgi:hypothetical protein